jgi:hypothetical protein
MMESRWDSDGANGFGKGGARLSCAGAAYQRPFTVVNDLDLHCGQRTGGVRRCDIHAWPQLKHRIRPYHSLGLCFEAAKARKNMTANKKIKAKM